MKYKLVIFDFDGTLADSFPFFLSTVNDLANEYNFKKISLVFDSNRKTWVRSYKLIWKNM